MPYGIYTRPTIEERFWPKVQKPIGEGCWLWIGRVNRFGYGAFTWIRNSGRVEGAHRVSWELHNGPVPYGVNVLHHCDVRNCVNPAHLFLGTDSDNMRDMVEKGRRIYHKGIKSLHCKLTEAQVREIKFSKLRYEECMKKFSVSYSTVDNIRHNRYWKHIV